MGDGVGVGSKRDGLLTLLQFKQSNFILHVSYLGIASKLLLGKEFQFRNNYVETSESEDAF